ncbi:DUF4267 domain-containing protein [Dyadobacter subterraneus]|uniref:DUF4267 domain-containing protein n=1 Tax=Dyadobacter subterraneus TaxID=2773304 RepID=A0ABR9WE53_9BACT|nr:DUF4267 domain-containing protein [Dyadobacter subterraneus]MBE9463705.1 DUF4267 domain-containing protein [Dyadobacter subterraneus]
MKTPSIYFWGPPSASYWLAALVACGVIFLGIRFILAPDTGAEGFEIPFARANEALAYSRIKGIRDIFPGLVVLICLIRRQPRATASAFGKATVIRVSDCFTVLAVNGA